MTLIDKQKRILVLDKDNHLTPVVDELLDYGDWDVTTIYDPKSVYNKAKTYHPDVVILDYSLLKKNCALICHNFKTDNELAQVPIIVITAYKTRQVRADYFKCDALFIKPLDMSVLASRMDYLMAS